MLKDKSGSGSYVRNENMSNQRLTEELHKGIIWKFEKQKVHSFFIDNIWGANAAEMQWINKFDKGFCFLVGVTDIFL